MPRVQYVIADANGVSRGNVEMHAPERMSLLTEWLKQVSETINYDFSDWHTFNSYASRDVVYYDLRKPKYEFRATLVIDKKAA